MLIFVINTLELTEVTVLVKRLAVLAIFMFEVFLLCFIGTFCDFSRFRRCCCREHDYLVSQWAFNAWAWLYLSREV